MGKLSSVLTLHSSLFITVKHSITDVAFKTFYGTLNSQANKLLRFVEMPGSDLVPPPSFKEVILQLVCKITFTLLPSTSGLDITYNSLKKEIMAAYDSSLVIVSEVAAIPGSDFRETLDAMIDPLLQICEMGSSKLSPYDHLVYTTNCLQYVRVIIVSYAFP